MTDKAHPSTTRRAPGRAPDSADGGPAAEGTVLTGDLVGSTALGPGRTDRAMAALEAAASLVETAMDARWRGPVRFTRTRGDGWQMVLPPAAPPLRAALTLIAALRAEGRDLSTRIAIARGAVRLPRGGDLNRAGGAAFVASGRALDAMEGPGIVDTAGGARAAAAVLAHQIAARWTEAQARAVLPMLAPDRPTQADVAQGLGISRQAVRQALAGAGFPALDRALALLEAAAPEGDPGRTGPEGAAGP